MPEALLRLERISQRYQRPNGVKVALDKVSLSIPQGAIVGVFGPTAAGKSTLLRIAAGMLPPDDGAVLFDGERLDRMASSKRALLRRREIACVWSDRRWDDRLGVLDHVALPLLSDGFAHGTAERRARETLLRCEVEQCVGMELCELSDGERQLVEIARALVIEPRLLLADGPAADLSIIEQERIMVLLATLAHRAGAAVLVTARDAQTLLRADPVLYLRDGQLVLPERETGSVVQFPPGGVRRAAGAADA
jgi:ABC-type lipoprotein export system ATPase subunit